MGATGQFILSHPIAQFGHFVEKKPFVPSNHCWSFLQHFRNNAVKSIGIISRCKHPIDGHMMSNHHGPHNSRKGCHSSDLPILASCISLPQPREQNTPANFILENYVQTISFKTCGFWYQKYFNKMTAIRSNLIIGNCFQTWLPSKPIARDTAHTIFQAHHALDLYTGPFLTSSCSIAIFHLHRLSDLRISSHGRLVFLGPSLVGQVLTSVPLQGYEELDV